MYNRPRMRPRIHPAAWLKLKLITGHLITGHLITGHLITGHPAAWLKLKLITGHPAGGSAAACAAGCTCPHGDMYNLVTRAP